MRKFTKRSVAVATAAVVAVGGAGAAYAAWLLSGSGAGAATAGTAQDLTLADINAIGNVNDNVTVTPAFFPGSTNDVAFTVENPNPFPVKITGITLTPGAASSTCLAGNVTVNSAAPLPTTAGALVVPPKSGTTNGSKAITYVGALGMIENSDDTCQGASFPITVALAAASGAV